MSDTSKLQIAVLAGTTRVQRRSINAARLVAEVGRKLDGVEITFVDPTEFNFPGDGNDPEGKDPRYTAITEKADAFFIVSPEYNHSIPGSLKRMLDSELKNYIHKPVAFAGVSDGPWGGVRAIEVINQTVRELGLVSTFTDVHFPKVPELFNDKGELLDDKFYKRIERSYTELIWMARTLKWGRENLESQYHPGAVARKA
jgi:NAD(P)H-dependent FMN reductase